MQQTIPMPAHTPWGKPDEITPLADGIVWYSTPSHGGFWLSPKRMKEMRIELEAMSYTGNQWFEEDVSWAAVALQWPELFNEEDRQRAERTRQGWLASRGNLFHKAEAS